MGGLIARYYVQRLGGDARVHTLVTLGTPHHGTRAARLIPRGVCKQLSPSSEIIAELAEPRRKRYPYMLVGGVTVVSRQDPDGQPAGLSRTAAGGLHHSPEAAGDDRRARLSQALPHLLGGAQLGCGRFAGPDDRDVGLAAHRLTDDDVD